MLGEVGCTLRRLRKGLLEESLAESIVVGEGWRSVGGAAIADKEEECQCRRLLLNPERRQGESPCWGLRCVPGIAVSAAMTTRFVLPQLYATAIIICECLANVVNVFHAVVWNSS